jgi:peptidyl-prolyl cis-trans isomerase A (cyclophilin A)
MKRLILPFVALLMLAGCLSAPKPPTGLIAPAKFQVNFNTSKGLIVVDVNRSDAPIGADRLYNLVKAGYFTESRFFRVVSGFVVQFGVASTPAMTKAWNIPIKDDPVKKSNTRGVLSFAASGDPDTRTTQVFFNLADNSRLDKVGFAGIGVISKGIEVVDSLYAGDRELPDQAKIERIGNSYLQKEFPNLDYIKTATITVLP